MSILPGVRACRVCRVVCVSCVCGERRGANRGEGVVRNVEVLEGGEALELVRQRGEAIDVQVERVQRRQLAHLRWHLLQSVPVHVQLCTRHTRTRTHANTQNVSRKKRRIKKNKVQMRE